ncbi:MULTISPECIES: hypothetical protein [Streptomyces]|uniref:hypothetical protein n=1 Tax=Streptomyces TaxID=1883 RepID=UPI0029BCE21F|nr:hypothetical protein [Streptomyces scabiei]MDX3205080.1 hypothetical protein [Streptomyces scabiei]
MPRNTRTAVAVCLTVLAVLAATGCSRFGEEYNDAPVSEKDDTSAEIYSMPDGFANVASKCDRHGNRIYTTRGDSNGGGKAVAVVPQDPTCAKASAR